MKKHQKAILEGILFVSGEPQPLKKIAKFLNLSLGDLKILIEELKEEYKKESRGFSFLELGENIQMVTSPEISQEIKEFLKRDFSSDLSPVLVETLAIVAYKGPLSRSQIDEIRGVNSSYPLRILSLRGLIDRDQHPTIPNAYLYKVSFDFLRYLGLNSLEELPNYAELRKKI